jgi:aminopeptidase-like protein
MPPYVRRRIEMSTGCDIYNLAAELFPICRSITGDGVRETLRVLKGVHPGIKIHEVPTGTRVFDWVVPEEWNVRDAYIECPDGSRIAEFKKNNLHLAGYSVPVDKKMPLHELQEHLHSLPEQPTLIPYVTSYYKKRFGFCLTHEERLNLREGEYRVFVDSELTQGSLTYGEVIIPGETENEIFFSSYICHPSLANDNLSGPCIAVHLAKWIACAPRRYTYRIALVPETIGSITYLSGNLDDMKRKTAAGFTLSCLGDPGNFSYIASRYGDTLADRAARAILKDFAPNYKTYSFLARGSDERQYCAPGADLPCCCVTRTKFGEYPEYHTSADNMDFITAEALGKSFEMTRELVGALEANGRYKVTTMCEPRLSPRGLYPSVSDKNSGGGAVRIMMNFLAYCDGRNDLFEISEIIGARVLKLIPIMRKLEDAGVIKREAEIIDKNSDFII